MGAGFVTELAELVNRHIANSQHRSDHHGDNLELMAEMLHRAGDQVAAMAQRWWDEADNNDAA